VSVSHDGTQLDRVAADSRTVITEHRRIEVPVPAGAAAWVLTWSNRLINNALVLLRAPVPGGAAVAMVVAAAAAGALVVLLRAAAQWRSDGPSWAALLRLASSRAGADLSGSALLAGALVAVAALTWQLPALLPLSLGCLVLAGTAVETRADARQR
jgi:hypothetical protein